MIEAFIVSISSIAWFSLAFAVKGGLLNPYFKEYRDENPILLHLLGSKAVSALMALAYVVFMATLFQTHIGIAIPFKYALLLIVGAWALVCAQRPWPEYAFILGNPDSYYFGYRGGIKECLTVLTYRGMACGGLMTLATGYIPFICFGVLMPAIVYPLLKKYGARGWKMTEWGIGALCYGAPMGLYVSGLL